MKAIFFAGVVAFLGVSHALAAEWRYTESQGDSRGATHLITASLPSDDRCTIEGDMFLRLMRNNRSGPTRTSVFINTCGPIATDTIELQFDDGPFERRQVQKTPHIAPTVGFSDPTIVSRLLTARLLVVRLDDGRRLHFNVAGLRWREDEAPVDYHPRED